MNMLVEITMSHRTLSSYSAAIRLVVSSLRIRSVSLIMLIATASIIPLKNTYSQTEPGDTFSLNLNNVDIYSLIETVSLRTGKNFIVDPRVRATVTVISSEPVNDDKLYELFLSVLDVHGYAAVPSGNFTKIVPMATGVQSAVPILGEQTDAGDSMVTEVIQIENVPAEKIIESLRPLLPESATIGAEAGSNTIIITDRAANIAKMLKIIRLLDG